MRIEEEGRDGRTRTEGALTPFPHLRPSSPRPSLTCKSGGDSKESLHVSSIFCRVIPPPPFLDSNQSLLLPREAYVPRPLPNEENNPPRGMQSNLARLASQLPCLASPRPPLTRHWQMGRESKRKHSLTHRAHTLMWSTTKRIRIRTSMPTVPRNC